MSKGSAASEIRVAGNRGGRSGRLEADDRGTARIAARPAATQHLHHRADVLLLRKMFGQCAERYDPNQPVVFAELAAALKGETPATAETSKESQYINGLFVGRIRSPGEYLRNEKATLQREWPSVTR
jgi:hypothetical protein